MPELPEVQAHAERLTAAFADRVLVKFVPITFTALKTAVPPPDEAGTMRPGPSCLTHAPAWTSQSPRLGRVLFATAQPRGR